MALLSGVRVVALEQYAAGPFATQQLADWGADVVKIEHPASGGDMSRKIGPFQAGDDSLFFQTFNRGKRSVALDLEQPEDRERFDALVNKADVLFANIRGDVAEKLELTYRRYAATNPRLVCCILTGFGLGGPRRDEPGMDYVIQAVAGYMSLTGEPDQPPTRCGVPVIDFATGFAAVGAIMAGLYHVQRSGRGLDVDVNLFDTALSMLSYLAVWKLNRNYEPGRQPYSAHPTVVPSQLFPTADGYIFIMCQKERFWTALCECIGRTDLLADPRFARPADRLANRAALVELLSAIFRGRTTAEWLRLFKGKVPCSPVHTLGEALSDPHVTARDRLFQVEHPEFGPITHLRGPINLGALESLRRTPGPGLGEHTDEVIAEWLGADRPAAARAAAPGGGSAAPVSALLQRPLRTWLMVPADREEMARRAFTRGADVVVFDLEDGVPPNRRPAAVQVVNEELARLAAGVHAGEPVAFVRIRAFGAGGREDLDALTHLERAGVCIPKVESARDVQAVAAHLEATRGAHVPLLALVESPAGVLAAREILASHPAVVGVALGGEDFLAEMGVTHSDDGLELLVPRANLALAARAHGRVAIDAVFTRYQETEGLRREAERSRRLGFHGKLVIHPRQIPVVHDVFAPGAAEVEWASRVVAAVAGRDLGETAVFAVDGEMVDAPVVRRAQAILRAAGRSVQPPAQEPPAS